jgi:outer membrane biosynthesis protein TonB
MPGQAAAAQGARPRSRALAWGGAAAGAIAVCGALFLFGGSDERSVPAAAPVQVAAAPAAPVMPVSLPAPAPAAAVLRDEPAAPAEPMTNPLADMAPAPAPHKERAAKPEKSAKVEKTERKEAHAKVAHAKAQERAREAAKDKKTKAKPGAVREQDSDVVLLAALIGHMEPKRGKATPAEQLASCRRYNAAGEEQCRARVCAAASPKEPACKRVQAARADAES